MINPNPHQQYLQNSIMSAGKGELTLMLYNGAIRFVKQGINNIENKNMQGAHSSIIRAQEIISELNGTLNMDYEISKNMSLLYDYINRRLVEANIKKDKQILEEALSFIEGFRDTWVQVIKTANSGLASGQ